MDNATMIVVVVLILALVFFGYSIMNPGNAGKAAASNSYPAQISGGGCGR